MRNARLSGVLTGTLVLVLFLFPGSGISKVSVQINIPPLVISAPPVVAVIPGTYVYFSPEVEVDLFFYGGYWYRPLPRRLVQSLFLQRPLVLHRSTPEGFVSFAPKLSCHVRILVPPHPLQRSKQELEGMATRKILGKTWLGKTRHA